MNFYTFLYKKFSCGKLWEKVINYYKTCIIKYKKMIQFRKGKYV